MKSSQRLLLLAALLPLAAACSDNLGVGAFPRLEVVVDDEALPEAGGTVSFGQALQLPITIDVQLINPGNREVRIDDVAWDTDAAGTPLVNPYVSLDWKGGFGPSSFPTTVSAGDVFGLTFSVVYNPPVGKALDDFRDSVLVIRSNARTERGDKALEEIVVTFSMPEKLAGPRVEPANYTFANATPTKPETQAFRIVNDPDLATASFQVTGITLEFPSNEFLLTDRPNLPATVLEPNNPGYQDLTFKVTYAPQDEGSDENAVLISTDVSSAPIRVPLKSNLVLGSFELSFEFPEQKFDFTNETTLTTRSVVVVSGGPGPITLKAPRIEPVEAQAVFEVVAYQPATKPETPDTEITSWPRGLTAGKSLRFEVTYDPPTGGAEPPNGQLVIPYEKPENGDIVLDLFAGVPKPKIELAPSTKSIAVTGKYDDGAAGTRHAVIYNHGNGNLDVKDVFITGPFGGAAKVFSLATPWSGTQTIPPRSLLVVAVDYDLSLMDKPAEGASESLSVVYYEPYTDSDETVFLGLNAEDSGDRVLPVADPGESADYAGKKAGETIFLSGAGSTDGSFPIDAAGYIWYLTAKPQGSDARLNANGDPVVAFVPDIAGAYELELVVYASQGGELLFSEAASVTVTVEP